MNFHKLCENQCLKSATIFRTNTGIALLHDSFDNMEAVSQDIVSAIDIWLEDLTDKEEGFKRINGTCEKIEHTILQMRYEGESSPEIEFIANTWTEILSLLTNTDQQNTSYTINENDGSILRKEQKLIFKILSIFECKHISKQLVCEMIMKIFQNVIEKIEYLQ